MANKDGEEKKEDQRILLTPRGTRLQPFATKQEVQIFKSVTRKGKVSNLNSDLDINKPKDGRSIPSK